MKNSNLQSRITYPNGVNKTIVVANGNSSVLLISNTFNSSSSNPLDDTPIDTSNLPTNSSILTENIASLNPFKFSSEYHDSALGLVYYNYRHYNSNDGRWLSLDPIAENGGYNLYGFVKNNPLEKWDILGQNLDGWNPWQSGTIRPLYTPIPKNCCPKGSRNRFTNGSWEYRTNEPNGVKPKINGCSAPEMIPIPEKYWNKTFKNACDKHDFCYDTCERESHSCNDIFYEDMKIICVMKPYKEMITCYIMAGHYVNFTKLFVKLYYKPVQDNVCKWINCPEEDA